MGEEVEENVHPTKFIQSSTAAKTHVLVILTDHVEKHYIEPGKNEPLASERLLYSAARKMFC